MKGTILFVRCKNCPGLISFKPIVSGKQMNPATRRIELLKLEGLGFSQSEIVNQLSKKANCSKRTIYQDFESRADWQPIVQSLSSNNSILMKIFNRYEQIYRHASTKYMTTKNEFAQIGALNLMLKSTNKLFEAAALPELTHRLEVLEEKAKKGVFVP